MATLAVPPGTVFGRWTVIEEAPRMAPRSDRAMRCLCECGTEKVLRLAALRAGTTTSCGCAQREEVRLVVPPGTVFGHLTVIGEADPVGPHKVRAILCRCECGTVKAIRLVGLRSGNTKSCGCAHWGVAAKDPARATPGEVPLYGKRARGRVAFVDEADFDLVMRYRWHLVAGRAGRITATSYAATSSLRDAAGRQVTMRMHTLLTGWPLVDHINGDGLNNRRSNLRPATPAQNQFNRRSAPHSSRFKGVRWFPPREKWNARIGYNGKLRHLGLFEDEVEAAKAYDEAARQLFGEFARLNFPDD